MSSVCKVLPFLFLAVTAGFSQTAPLSTWVQLGPGGQIIARQVFTGTQKCINNVQTPGGNVAMVQRGPTNIPGFGITVCEATIPATAASANINGVGALPLPNSSSAAAVIGDTGCEGDTAGLTGAVPEDEDDDLTPAPSTKSKPNCALPSVWPFGTITANMAGRKPAPGLVIHVGDYLYVKTENWPTWYSQFFQPAAPLLRSSAWLFVRGNHETICRHGTGYFLLLDPRPYASLPPVQQGCPNPTNEKPSADATAPYLVPFAGTNYVVLDSSGATCDFAGEKCQGDTRIPTRAQQLQTWTQLMTAANGAVPAGATGVLLTHRAVWGAKAETPKPPVKPFQIGQGLPACPAVKGGRMLLAINSTLQASWMAVNPKAFSMVMSGHTHTFEMLAYSKTAIPQLVAGNGGVTLTHSIGKAKDCGLATMFSGKSVLPISHLHGEDAWGYTILNSKAALTLYGVKGGALLTCSLAGAAADCKKPGKKGSGK